MSNYQKIKGSSKHKNALKGKSDLMESSSVLSNLVFSFKDYDPSQGQRFDDWHQNNLLVSLLERIREYSRMTLKEAEKGRFTLYGRFPLKTDFYQPTYVTPDAKWASFSYQWKNLCRRAHCK